MLGDLLGWAIGMAMLMAAITIAAGGCVVAARQRRAARQPTFASYAPRGNAARWRHTRDQPDAADPAPPLATDHDPPVWRWSSREPHQTSIEEGAT